MPRPRFQRSARAAMLARFHDLTLGRMARLLKQGGYCGYINLDTIVNERGIWPLEFTCRFGYPGYAILEALQETSWSELFHAMVTRGTETFRKKTLGAPSLKY
jgi:phosphoribosylamine---glycine ligase